MSGEESYIKAIKGGMISIKNGEKSPKDANVGSNLNRLKAVNPGMYDDYLKEYKEVLKEYNSK